MLSVSRLHSVAFCTRLIGPFWEPGHFDMVCKHGYGRGLHEVAFGMIVANTLWQDENGNGVRTVMKEVLLMSDTGLSTFDKTVQTTNTWLHEIEEELHLDDRQKAYHALRGVLLNLRDRLPVDEAMDLASELPMLIRGLYFEGYKAANKPVKYDASEFLVHVQEELESGNVTHSPNEVLHVVLGVMKRHISDGEARQVHDAMPKDIQKLWPN